MYLYWFPYSKREVPIKVDLKLTALNRLVGLNQLKWAGEKKIISGRSASSILPLCTHLNRLNWISPSFGIGGLYRSPREHYI